MSAKPPSSDIASQQKYAMLWFPLKQIQILTGRVVTTYYLATGLWILSWCAWNPKITTKMAKMASIIRRIYPWGTAEYWIKLRKKDFGGVFAPYTLLGLCENICCQRKVEFLCFLSDCWPSLRSRLWCFMFEANPSLLYWVDADILK